MKRLTGLFLAVCCLAFTLVQPVAPLAPAKAVECQCGGECQCDHDCSRNACPMPAGAPSAPNSLPRTAQVVIEVSKPDNKQTIREKPSLPPIALLRFARADFVPSSSPAIPSQVPLFTRHCAFLI